jgi:DNA/RNA-binding domain of Phe-tRNA-synthetase-like protein
VTWAEGCGTSGAIDPLNGNSKMPWKVEWAAKWWTWGVTIEGAGKDHGSAGGSYDVARKVCKDVFGTEPPLKIVYEFFLSQGRKMSSSKGIGMNGEELLEVLSPEVARYLMIKTRPNQAVEFEPRNTYVIPKLYDDYQKAAEHFYTQSEEIEIARSFELSQINSHGKPPTIGFTKIATLVQMPNMRNTLNQYNAEQWEDYAKVWIEKYAPDSDTFAVLKEIPGTIQTLSEAQRKYLENVAQEIEGEWTAEDLQIALYEWAKEANLSSKEAFAAIYTALIGKSHGPRAAWLLLDQPKDFIKRRFTQDVTIANEKTQKTSVVITSFNNSSLFTVDKTITERYPSISIGIAVIKGVTIVKTDANLEKEKQDIVQSLAGLTTEQLGQYPEILSYRKLYKEMGVDWHSRRPSPEALLRRVALNKGLYSVNTCVDAYNLVVMKQRVSVGAFDLDKLQFPTELRFAKQGEEILLLGDEQPIQYTEKELAYFDQQGGYNIDFNYRDAQRTAVQLETKNLYINVDGIYDITPTQVQQALQETCDIITKYCGGKIEEFGIITSQQSA